MIKNRINKAKSIQNFFYGQYFADGVRLTFGTVLPTVIFAFFGNIPMGLSVSFGALWVGLSDSPGPADHRRNGLFICLGLVVLVTLITNLINFNPWLLGIEIVVFSFIFSMFAIYGSRAASVGAMGILAMILNTDSIQGGELSIWEHTYLVCLGGIWYILLSLAVTQFRPYRLAQQELGECIHQVAKYIRLKAKFYDKNADNSKNFLEIIDQQVLVHNHQELVREMVFRDKKTIKDTTKTGRFLILVFSDLNDLFEQIMATQYEYTSIQEKYGSTGVLEKFNKIINKIADELDHLGFQIHANHKAKPLYNLKSDLEDIYSSIEALNKNEKINTVPLKKILINVRNLSNKVESLYVYFNIQKATNEFKKEEVDYSKFVQKNPIDFKILRNNFNKESSIFRHAVRMGVVMGTGYLISEFFEFGSYSYWILLTILVILKPGFGLTKQRNFQRLTGTIIGGITGVIILLLVHDKIALFALFILFMIATYSLIRINYIISVMFMTPYVLIMLTFFENDVFQIVQERIIDTAIGSTLAFLSSYIILPNWETHRLQEPMFDLLKSNYKYLSYALRFIAGEKIELTTYKLSRQEVYIKSGNMGSAFQRLLTEPKSKQKNARELNKFVVFNHILSSYTMTLMTNVRNADNSALTGEHVKLIRKTLYHLANSIKILQPHVNDQDFQEVEVSIPEDLDANNVDSPEQKIILEQLQFLNRISIDIYRTCEKLQKDEEENDKNETLLTS